MKIFQVKCAVTSDAVPPKVEEHVAHVVASNIRSAIDQAEVVALAEQADALQAEAMVAVFMCNADAVEREPVEVRLAEVVPITQVKQ